MNVIINNGFVQPTDQHTLFEDEEVVVVDKPFSCLSQLLKHLDVYGSTSQARKAGRYGEIPVGWGQIKASKKVELYLWNPSE